MTATYAVTFEFETRSPLTLRGTVSASGMPTLVARAARTAMREAGRQTWASVVVVIERGNPSGAVSDDSCVDGGRAAPHDRTPAGYGSPPLRGAGRRPRQQESAARTTPDRPFARG
jgi:hypothetical protein